MLSWALRYLAVVLVVGLGFALLAGIELPERGRDPEPAAPAASAPAVVIEAGPRGHFLLEAMVDGEPLTFLVDTGASDLVLAPADARRLGFRASDLRFTRRYQSANGTVRAAPVRLREVRIGPLSVFDVEAAVNEAPLGISLLGMSFLERLAGYRIEGDRLHLHW